MAKPGKPRMCAICRIVPPMNAWAKVCGPDCAEVLVQMDNAKAARKAVKSMRQNDKARKEALKTRSDHIRELQVIFNACIRQRDKNSGYPCISSGRPLDWSGNNVDAGHYRSIGSAPHLRFDERNVHAQSKQDNRYGSGNAVDYRIGLIARYGVDYVEALEADNEPRKWSIKELVAMKAYYRAWLRELKKAGK